MATKKNKKNNSKKTNYSKKKVLKEYKKINKKEVLDKEIKNIRKDNINLEFNNKNKVEEINIPSNIHEKIQSFISILFTIIVFILLIFLVIVIYNNYLKPKEKINKEELCEEYIKKDYNINKERINNYIIDNRYILYNLDKFDKNNITSKDVMNFSKFIIWNSETDYEMCDEEEKCLVTKKEMNLNDLKSNLEKFIDKDKMYLDFNVEQDKDIYLYENGNNVVLTFNEFDYQTLKHEIVDILIDEDNITIYFALSEKIPNSDYYKYVGNKKVLLKYVDKKFILEKIEKNK